MLDSLIEGGLGIIVMSLQEVELEVLERAHGDITVGSVENNHGGFTQL